MISNFFKKIADIFSPCPVVKTQTSEGEKEKYYNNKYPKEEIVYRGRYIPNTTEAVAIDVRNFFNEYDSAAKKIVDSLSLSRLSEDEKALKCFLWVVQNIKYVSDKEKAKRDYWQFAFETLHYSNGDCEDGSILLANLLLVAGIPYWKIRLSVGDTKAGTHCYVVYYCESKDKWVILDWCYKINKDKISERNNYKNEDDYLSVNFSWNQKYSFSNGLNNKAKKILDENKSVGKKR